MLGKETGRSIQQLSVERSERIPYNLRYMVRVSVL
jgi:hypothetical protein